MVLAVVPSSLITVLLLLLVLMAVVVLVTVVLMDGSFGGLPLDGIFEYIIVVCSGVCVCNNFIKPGVRGLSSGTTLLEYAYCSLMIMGVGGNKTSDNVC